MRTASIFALALIVFAGALGCAKSTPKTTVRIPPRIDLTQLEVIGVVEFDSSSERELASLATQSFTDEARRDQGLVRIAGLGSKVEALESVDQEAWNADTFKALGNEHGVATILTGKLTISEARPSISIAPSLESGSVSALIKATLAVQLIEVSSGASIWSSSASASHNVGNISVYGGKDVVVNAKDPKGAYGPLVDSLVEQVTRDFKATWVRQ
jgi:TolB-like protein